MRHRAVPEHRRTPRQRGPAKPVGEEDGMSGRRVIVRGGLMSLPGRLQERAVLAGFPHEKWICGLVWDGVMVMCINCWVTRAKAPALVVAL